jgi:hypothetical protein
MLGQAQQKTGVSSTSFPGLKPGSSRCLFLIGVAGPALYKRDAALFACSMGALSAVQALDAGSSPAKDQCFLDIFSRR